MNTIILLRNILLALATAVMCCTLNAQVQVTMTIPNLGSPYLSDYLGNSNNQVIILSNTSGQTQNVMLKGAIEQMNRPGYYLRTKEGFRPAAPITLMPFETRTFFANQADFSFFNESNLETNVPKDVMDNMRFSGLLPEGEYQICLRAFDYSTNTPLSEEAPAGCQFFFVTLGTPPQIITPICNDTINTLFPNFTWTPAISMVPLMNINYSLYIVEYNSRALNPSEVMEQSINYRGGNPIVIENIQFNGYMYSPTDLPLKDNTTYIMCVVAQDGRNRALFENQGRSEICMFHVNQRQRNIESDTDVTDVSIIRSFSRPFQTFKSAGTRVSGRLTHRFKDEQLVNSEQVEYMAALHGSEEKYPGVVFNPVGSLLDLVSPTFGNTGDNSESNNNSRPDLNGYFNGTFDFTNYLDDFQREQGNKYGHVPIKVFKDNLFEHNPYMSGSRPLAHTSISLVEQYILVGDGADSDINNFTILDQSTGISGFGGELPPSFEPKIIQTVRTDADGRYEFNALIHRPAGIVSSSIGVASVVSVLGGALSGKYIIRTYRIIVEDPRYYSPDVMINLKPGEDMHVKTQTALIRSYRLKADVKSTGGLLAEAQTATIEGMLIRKMGDIKSIKNSHPSFEPDDPDDTTNNTVILSEYGIPGTNYYDSGGFLSGIGDGLGVAYYRINMSVNDGGGGMLEIRNLVAHIDNNSSMYYLILQTPHHSVYNYGPVAIPVYTGNFSFQNGSIGLTSEVYLHGSNSAYKNRDYNYQYIEPQVSVDATLYPNHPEIYLQIYEENIVEDKVGGVGRRFGATAVLSNVRVDLHCQGCDGGFTDENGKFRKKLQIPAGSNPPRLNTFIKLSKSGYVDVNIPKDASQANTGGWYGIQMGERYPAQRIYMKPRGNITLEVIDELAEPTRSYVQFGDGLVKMTSKVCSETTDIIVSDNSGSAYTPLTVQNINIRDVTNPLGPLHNPVQVDLFIIDHADIELGFGAGEQGYSQMSPALAMSYGDLSNLPSNISDRFMGQGQHIPGKGSMGVQRSGQSQVIGMGAAGGQTIHTNEFNCREMVAMRAPSGNAVPLRIEPLATRYETLDTTVDVPANQNQTYDLGTFVAVYKRRKAKVHVSCGTIEMPIFDDFGRRVDTRTQEKPCNDINAIVKLHNTSYFMRNTPDSVFFSFMSPGNTFRLTVDFPSDGEFNFVPIDTFIQIDYNAVKDIRITLQEAKLIRGKVTDKDTGNPIPGAKVYVENGTNSIETVYVETFSDQEGNYVLKGIKPNYQSGGNWNVDPRDLYAVKSGGDITYIGEKKENVNIYSNPTVNFQLKSLDGWDISRLLGYRVEILSAIPEDDELLQISGNIIGLPTNGNFSPERGDKVCLPFKNVRVVKHVLPQIDKKPIAVPENETVLLDVNLLRIKVNRNFVANLYGVTNRPNLSPQNNSPGDNSQSPYHFFDNGGYSLIETPQLAQFPPKLRIFKESPQTGSIWGATEIKLESFEFANDFEARFYLGHSPSDCRVKVFQTKVGEQNNIPSIPGNIGMGNTNPSPRDTFYIGTRGEGHKLIHPTYRVEGFPAFARTDESRLIDSLFSLNTTVIVSVPDMEPDMITLPVGHVLISPYSMSISYFGDGLSFNLGTWEVTTSNWRFNQNTSSIELFGTKVLTKYIKFNIGTLYLQPNKPPITVTELDYDDLEESLMLSQVTPLELYNGGSVQLAHEQPFHSSNKKVYRLTISNVVNENSSCCFIEMPDHLDDRLNFKYFHIYSDGYEDLDIENKSEVSFYGGYKLKEVKIEGGVNYFDIIGTPNLNFPRNGKADNLNTTFRFRKPGEHIVRDVVSNTFRISNLRNHMSFEGDPASSSTRVLSNGTYQVYGTLKVRTSRTERFSLRALLTYANNGNDIKIETFHIEDNNKANPMPGNIKQQIRLSNSGSNYFDVLEGIVQVGTSKGERSWLPFEVHTELQGSDVTKGLKDNEKKLWFVAGINNIVAKEKQWLGIKTMNGMPDDKDKITFKVSFDFNSNSVRGDWKVPLSELDGVVISLGANVTIGGDFGGGFKFSSEGFYFYFVANDIRVQPIPVSLNVFSIIGSTTYANIDQDVKSQFFNSGKSVWNRMSDFPRDIRDNGLTGIFMGYNASILDFSIGIDLALVGFELGVDIGFDGYSSINFNEDIAFGFGALYYVNVKVEAWVLFCSLCIDFEAQAAVCGQLTTQDVTLGAMASLSFGGGICGVSFSETIKLNIDFKFESKELRDFASDIFNFDFTKYFKVRLGGSGTESNCLTAKKKPKYRCGS